MPAAERSKLLKALWPKLHRRGGFGAAVAVVVSSDDPQGLAFVRVEYPAAQRGSKAVRMEQAARRAARGVSEATARQLAAIASIHRLRILTGLLEGPATYRWLQKRTGLKAGPLYHHINQLRLVGLLGPKSRDVYVLTARGRNAILGAIALSRLVGR